MLTAGLVLAIMVIPGADIPSILENAAEQGLKAALIFSSYFGEDGDAVRQQVDDVYAEVRIGHVCPGGE